jgi:hypothetical protein
MHVLPQATIFELVARANCSLIEIREDGLVGIPGWISNSLLVRKIKP